MPRIIVHKDESIDNVMKTFRRDVIRGGILSKLKEKEFYLKPSDRRKLKKANRKKNSHKN